MRNVLVLLVVLAGMSAACKKDAGAEGEKEAIVNLSKIATLVAYTADSSGAFPEAPPCAGVPPVNEFSVPRSPASVVGQKYTPAMNDWSGPWRGFHFALASPIQVLYCYESDGRSFSIHGSTDVDGDGIWAHYQRRGELLDGRAAIGPLAVERAGE